MFSKEFLEVLVEILKSWQVIAATVAMLIYIKIVSYVAQSYRRPRVKRARVGKAKRVETLDSGPEEADGSGDSNDELGLEED